MILGNLEDDTGKPCTESIDIGNIHLHYNTDRIDNDTQKPLKNSGWANSDFIHNIVISKQR